MQTSLVEGLKMRKYVFFSERILFYMKHKTASMTHLLEINWFAFV